MISAGLFFILKPKQCGQAPRQTRRTGRTEEDGMKLGTGIQITQKQTLSQIQIQSLGILALDTLELKHFLKNEYLENPMVECRYPGGSDVSVAAISYHQTLGELVEHDDEDYREVADRREEGIRQYLLDQLPGGTSDAVRAAAEYLIGCLEDNGYFTQSLDELAQELGTERAFLEEVLALLRSLEPCGIFARDLGDCLRMQLKKSGETDPFLYELTEQWMDALLHGRLGEITRKTGRSTAEVRSRLERIAECAPNPMRGFSNRGAGYLEPDLIARRGPEGWQLEINDSFVENYSLNDTYIRMMQEAEDPELKEYFRKKLERARGIFSGILQRRRTILSVAGEILRRQEDYLEKRSGPKPLTMAQVAKALDIHISTVSRAVSGKYLQYPGGIVLLKDLFRGSVQPVRSGTDARQDTPDGLTADHVKECLRALIEGEDKKNPLSDSRLEALLKKEGFPVSRRTVAKYRDALGIPDSRNR